MLKHSRRLLSLLFIAALLLSLSLPACAEGFVRVSAPMTGDEAPIALYAALAIISLGAVAVGAWLILRKQNRK